MMKALTMVLLAGALAGCGAMGHEQMRMAGGGNPMMQGSSKMQGGMCGMGGMGGMGSQAQGMSGMQGMQGMCPMAKGMQAMDSNKDGMVSRDEYLAAHGAMFDSMKKNDRGHVAMADAGMCPMMSGARR